MKTLAKTITALEEQLVNLRALLDNEKKGAMPYPFEEGKVYKVWDNRTDTPFDVFFKFKSMGEDYINYHWGIDTITKILGKDSTAAINWDNYAPALLSEYAHLLPVGHEDGLASTIEQVYEEVKPLWYVQADGIIKSMERWDEVNLRFCKTNVPSEAAAKKLMAYAEILTLCEYANSKFESDGDVWLISECGTYSYVSKKKHGYGFNSLLAANFAASKFSELFITFQSNPA